MTGLIRLIREEHGQGIGEYAMIFGLVALVVAIALQSVGLDVLNIFQQVGNGITAVQSFFGP
jgi:Flp pilus assembly pilin Flp